MLRTIAAMLTFSVYPVFAWGGTPSLCKGACLDHLKAEDKVQQLFLSDSFTRATCSDSTWIGRFRRISKVDPVGTPECPFGLKSSLNLYDPPALVASERLDSIVLRADIDFASWTAALPTNAVDSAWIQRPAIKRSTIMTTLGIVGLLEIGGLLFFLLNQPATNHM